MQFAAQEDVFGYREFGDEVEFLVDNGDAALLGIARAAQRQATAIKEYFALIIRYRRR